MANLLIDGSTQIEALQILRIASKGMTLPEVLGAMAAGLTIARRSSFRQQIDVDLGPGVHDAQRPCGGS